MNKVIRFKHWDCAVEFSTYGNGRTAIILNDQRDGSRVCVATVNVDDDLGHGEVVIKDYSENEGVLSSLLDAGVVSYPLRLVTLGYQYGAVCRLLVDGN